MKIAIICDVVRINDAEAHAILLFQPLGDISFTSDPKDVEVAFRNSVGAAHTVVVTESFAAGIQARVFADVVYELDNTHGLRVTKHPRFRTSVTAGSAPLRRSAP